MDVIYYILFQCFCLFLNNISSNKVFLLLSSILSFNKDIFFIYCQYLGRRGVLVQCPTIRMTLGSSIPNRGNENYLGNGEQSISTLGSLCPPCYTQDTASEVKAKKNVCFKYRYHSM